MITYFDEPLELIAKFEEIKGSGRVICIFSGSENAQGKNWCPDCDAAKPMIQKLIDYPDRPTILYGKVAERNSWVGRADHPYKQHPVLKARGVPTVVLFDEG
jgi:hypothetical protein